MWKLFRQAGYLLGLILSLQSCTSSNEKIVAVTLYTESNSIESDIQIETGSNGQRYITVSFSNKGSVAGRIDSVLLVLHPDIKVSPETNIIYGGTCMGRTPIKQTSMADSVSNSGTFVLIKNSEHSYSHIGILSWNTFLPYIHCNSKKGFTITANGEGKIIQAGETIRFEKIVLTSGSNWQDLLYDYGSEIAKEQKITAKEVSNLKGWSTWDYYGRVYDTKDVYKNIDQLSLHKDANIVQIDGGWWTARGDYLSVRKNLQGGMKAIAEYAKMKGYKAGIHLDGFRGDKNSELYKKHPDWFLKDQNGQVICQAVDKGDAFMQYIYYDYSNPAVCEYMKNVLRTIKNDWGYSYFKIDFMRYGLQESILAEQSSSCGQREKKLTKINSYNNNMTSVERTRAGLLAMREGIGEAYFLGCSSIFGPTLGIVDGLRTGADICPTFNFYQACTLQNAGNFYLNQTVVQNDADYLVVRNKDDEEPSRAWGENKFGGNTTYDEAKMWSDYIALFGGPKINSDNLLTLRPERKQLINNAFAFKTAKRFIPLDLWNHAKDKNDAFNIVLAENEDGVYLSLFNWANQEKTFKIDGLIDQEVTDAKNNKKIIVTRGKINVTLKSHSSIILKLKGESFDYLRKKISFN